VCFACFRNESWRSSVVLITTTNESRPHFLKVKTFFSLHSVQFGSGTLQWIPEALSPGIKPSGRKGELPRPSTTIFENTWNCTCISSDAFMAWYLIKHSNYCAFTITSKLYNWSNWMWGIATPAGFHNVLRRIHLRLADFCEISPSIAMSDVLICLLH